MPKSAVSPRHNQEPNALCKEGNTSTKTVVKLVKWHVDNHEYTAADKKSKQCEENENISRGQGNDP